MYSTWEKHGVLEEGAQGLVDGMIWFVLMISGTRFSAYLLLMKLCDIAFNKPELGLLLELLMG